MKAVQPRHDPVRLLWRRVRLVALGVAVIIAASGVIDIYKKERASAQMRTEATSQLAALAAQDRQLTAQVHSLQTDRGMEAAVRSQYQMGHQGEGVITIVDQPVPTPVEATSTLRTLLHKVLPWW